MAKHKQIDAVYPYTYIIINNITKRKYYGVRWGNVSRKICPKEDIGVKYFTSSKYIMSDFKENIKNYTIIVHFTFDTKEEAILYESRLLKRLIKKKLWDNKTDNHAILNTEHEISRISERMKKYRKDNPMIGTNHPMYGKSHSETAKKLISEKAKERYKNGFKHPLKGVGHSEESKKKMSKSREGKTLAELIGVEAAEKNINSRRKKTIERNKNNNCMKNPDIVDKVRKAKQVHYLVTNSEGTEIFTSVGNKEYITKMKKLGFGSHISNRFSKEKELDGRFFLEKKRYPASGGVVSV